MVASSTMSHRLPRSRTGDSARHTASCSTNWGTCTDRGGLTVDPQERNRALTFDHTALSLRHPPHLQAAAVRRARRHQWRSRSPGHASRRPGPTRRWSCPTRWAEPPLSCVGPHRALTILFSLKDSLGGGNSLCIGAAPQVPVEQHAATIARVQPEDARRRSPHLNKLRNCCVRRGTLKRPPPPPPTSQLTFSATTLNFGQVQVGGVQAETLFIRNSTGRPVHIQAPQRAGTFSWDSFAVTLLNNTQREVTVEFTPRSQGNASGALTITSDSPGSPHRILLRGFGLRGASPR